MLKSTGFIFLLIYFTHSAKSYKTVFADSMWIEAQSHKGEEAIHFLLDNFFPVYNKNYDDGITWMTATLQFAELSGNKQLIGKSHLNLGIAWYLRGDYPACLVHHQKALEIFELIDDKSNIGRTCNELSVYSRKQKQYEKGLEYLDRSYEVCSACNDSGCVETSLNNRAVIYEMMGEYELALTYYRKAENIAKLTNNKSGLAYIYSDAAECYRVKNDYDSCTIFIDKAIALHEEIGNLHGVAICLINKAALFGLRKMYPKSIATFQECIKLGEELNYTDLLKNAHYELGKTYAAVNDFEMSFYHIDKSYALGDSLLNQDKIKSLSEMEVKYQTEKVEKDFLKEKQEGIETDLILANRNKWLLGISGFFLASVFFGLFIYQRKTRLTQAEKDRALIDEREKGIQAVFDATEEERQRIAKDLHDGVGQQMSGLKIAWENLSISIKGIDEKESKRIDELSKILDSTASEVRVISHQMMPKVLEEFGLTPAIEQMLESSLGLTNLKFSFEHYNFDQRLSRKIELSLFRITQELLNNVIKHSGANFVSVQIFKNKNQLILIVEDNGKGFNISNKKDGHGLLNIHSRLNTINGQVNYEASETAGTTATIRIDL